MDEAHRHRIEEEIRLSTGSGSLGGSGEERDDLGSGLTASQKKRAKKRAKKKMKPSKACKGRRALDF